MINSRSLEHRMFFILVVLAFYILQLCNAQQNKQQQQSLPRYENMSIKYYAFTVAPPVVNENKFKPYCSFFNNREPTAQINLKNCTWYHKYSCCLQSEIESTFSKVNSQPFFLSVIFDY
jgi:hypothetical protein